MKIGQSTDGFTKWRRSFATYIPPELGLFEFEFDSAASGVVRDRCAWRGHPGCPAGEVALSWTCGSRKVLVSTRLSKDTRWDTAREDVLRLTRSQIGASALGEPISDEVAARRAVW